MTDEGLEGAGNEDAPWAAPPDRRGDLHDHRDREHRPGDPYDTGERIDEDPVGEAVPTEPGGEL